MVSTCNYLQYHLEISVVSFEETTNIVGHISNYLQFLKVYPILIHGRWNVASPKAAWTGPHEDSESQGALNVWKAVPNMKTYENHSFGAEIRNNSGMMRHFLGHDVRSDGDISGILVGYIMIYLEK